MFDLETVFHTRYVDYRFLGKTLIKNVLPILELQFCYNSFDIQNGTLALNNWGRLVLETESFEDLETVKNNLLNYCKLDTLAIVKIYEKLTNLN